jgi:pimeloyl-ACP methyl ester carboxylesterase
VNLSNHRSDFVNTDGIRLHYLDWGGKGPTLIFLTGMGSSAYIFNKFAPRFNDKFHVLALTRHGHGDSDIPETGYDADTLTEDIRQFMDRLNVEKAILAGHSLAGAELLVILSIVSLALYYALPLLYQNYIVPVEQNTTRVMELQSQQEQTEQQLADPSFGFASAYPDPA